MRCHLEVQTRGYNGPTVAIKVTKDKYQDPTLMDTPELGGPLHKPFYPIGALKRPPRKD